MTLERFIRDFKEAKGVFTIEIVRELLRAAKTTSDLALCLQEMGELPVFKNNSDILELFLDIYLSGLVTLPSEDDIRRPNKVVHESTTLRRPD